VNIAELGIAYPQLVIETSERYNREQPMMVKNFLKGFIDGINYAATHKEETRRPSPSISRPTTRRSWKQRTAAFWK